MQEKKGKHQMMSTWRKLMTMMPRLVRRTSRNQMRRKYEINA